MDNARSSTSTHAKCLCTSDLSVCRAGDAAINAAEGVALLCYGSLQDVQHDPGLAEDKNPVALCHQLCQQPHHKFRLAASCHSCSDQHSFIHAVIH